MNISNRILAAGMALVLASAIGAAPAFAGETKIAVAANFTAAAKEIGAAFEKSTGNRAIFSFGSTGQLYAQITEAAPFDVFLAADRARPKRAVDGGYAMASSRFTYATGRIVLYSKQKGFVKDAATLRAGNFDRIAICNPRTAPYGAAAVEAMKALGVYDQLRYKFVEGTNVAQAYQFVKTGNAELGFVALSQVILEQGGSRWIVPSSLYTPIAQDAVLLIHGAGNPVAREFLDFLRGPAAAAVKQKYGYGPGE